MTNTSLLFFVNIIRYTSAFRADSNLIAMYAPQVKNIVIPFTS